MKIKFSNGDKVFAKVRGYPYWPAKIISPVDENANKIKYNIIFYGSGEKAVVKAEDVEPFLPKRHELGRPKKSKSFNDAMAQIEKEMNLSYCVNGEETVSEEPTTPVKPKKKSSVGRTPKSSPQSDSTAENVSARGRKRRNKTFSETETTEPTPKVKRRGKSSGASSLTQNSLTNPRKTRSPSKRNHDKLDDTFKFVLDGVSVSLALNAYRPSLNCPKSTLDWNRLVNNKASDLVEELNEGKMSLDDAQMEIDEFTRLKTKEKKREYDENDKEYKTLKLEGKLLQLDVKIKTALTLAHANPDDAIKGLDEIMALSVTSLMLKKHPEIVDTYKKISRYVGNLSSWDMTDVGKERFLAQAELIRDKAIQVLDKFSCLFDVGEGESFSRIFSTELGNFNRATQKLSQEEFFSLVKEPELGPD